MKEIKEIIIDLLIIFLFYLLTSCGTSHKSLEVSRHEDMSYLKTDSFFLNVDRMNIEEIISRGKLSATIRIRELSAPDSLGNQYTTKETEITLTNEAETVSTKRDTTNVEAGGAGKEEGNKNLDEEIKEVTKKDNRPVPDWVWNVAGALLLFLIIYYIKPIANAIRKIV
jgi:hypothetical protein